jgi:hypothetical protein
MGPRLFWAALVVILGAMMANSALGMGTEVRGNKELSPANYADWPGLDAAVNDASRVYQNWVNGNESCYYRGDVEALNGVIETFRQAKLEVHQVVLLPGPGVARTFDGEEIACQWRLHIVGGIAGAMAKRDGEGTEVFDVHPTLYVYVGDGIALEKLTFPDGIKLLGTADLRRRYLAGIQSSSKHARGYGAFFLSEIDASSCQSAGRVATLLDAEDPWLTAMALTCLERFGANARHVVARLEKHPEDERNAERLKEVIASIKGAEDRPESDRRRWEQIKAIEKYLKSKQEAAAGEKTSLSLDDFRWTVGATRSAASVMREIPACVGFTEGKDEEFRLEQGTLSVVTLTLEAEKAGHLMLLPEMFLVRDGGLYGVFYVCHGVRVVEPKPGAKVAAFLPPSEARQWPGHAGDVVCEQGDSVVIELLFREIVREDAELLAASPRVKVQPSKGREVESVAVGNAIER